MPLLYCCIYNEDQFGWQPTDFLCKTELLTVVVATPSVTSLRICRVYRLPLLCHCAQLRSDSTSIELHSVDGDFLEVRDFDACEKGLQHVQIVQRVKAEFDA